MLENSVTVSSNEKRRSGSTRNNDFFPLLLIAIKCPKVTMLFSHLLRLRCSRRNLFLSFSVFICSHIGYIVKHLQLAQFLSTLCLIVSTYSTFSHLIWRYILWSHFICDIKIQVSSDQITHGILFSYTTATNDKKTEPMIRLYIRIAVRTLFFCRIFFLFVS